MHRKDMVEIKRKARLWAIYEVTEDGLELSRKEVTFGGRPECKRTQHAVPIARGHVVFTMAYEDFMQNARKSEFIKEETNNAD